MIEVLLGGNVFRDCETLIAVAGTPVLRVAADPLDVALSVPVIEQGANGHLRFRMANGKLDGDETAVRQVSVRRHEDEVRVFFANHLLLTASALTRTTVHLHLRFAAEPQYDDKPRNENRPGEPEKGDVFCRK